MPNWECSYISRGHFQFHLSSFSNVLLLFIIPLPIPFLGYLPTRLPFSFRACCRILPSSSSESIANRAGGHMLRLRGCSSGSSLSVRPLPLGLIPFPSFLAPFPGQKPRPFYFHTPHRSFIQGSYCLVYHTIYSSIFALSHFPSAFC